MTRVSKFRRSSGYWYVRYWLASQPVDESARTKSETTAEAYRVRREIEINVGVEPLKHADIGTNRAELRMQGWQRRVENAPPRGDK